jgi:tryptophan-rich sensory protein
MIDQSKRRQLGWLVAYLGMSFGAAALGGTATAKSVNGWYRTLRKSSLTPPDWVFGPVWTLLYTLMAISAWRVKRAADEHPERREAARAASTAWFAQLALNLSWSVIFFGQRRIGGGLVVIGALWASIIGYIVTASQVSRTAAWLFAPYLAWVSFAAFLNYRLWELNRGVLSKLTRRL